MASQRWLGCLVDGRSAAEDITRRRPYTHSVSALQTWDESRVENPDERVVIQNNCHELRLAMWDYFLIFRTTKLLVRAFRRITLLQPEIHEFSSHFRSSHNGLEFTFAAGCGGNRSATADAGAART